MPSPKLSNSAAQQSDGPTLRERAVRLRDAAGRFLKRGAVAPDDHQPQPASLPEGSPADRTLDAFPGAADAQIEAGGGHPELQDRDTAAGGRVPLGERDMGRHETFDTATPVAAEMLASTMLGRGRRDTNATIDSEQAASNAVAAIDLDPIPAAIERHRAAYVEWDRLSRVWTDMLPDEPGYKDAVAAAEEPGRREVEAFDALVAARPTNFDGLHRLIEYLPTATRQTAVDTQDGEEQRALEAIREGLRGLAGTDLWQPMLGAKGAPSTLASACDWVMRHRAWVETADLDDDGTREEIDRMEAVFQRAIAEPSRSPADLAAKARMLLDDLIEGGALDETYADQALTIVVLREIIALESTPFMATQVIDPVLAAIRASREAEAAVKDFSGRVQGRRLTRSDFEEEERLVATQRRSLDAAWATIPTTQAGRLALVDYVRFQLELRGYDLDRGLDNDDHVWGDACRALASALTVPVQHHDRDGTAADDAPVTVESAAPMPFDAYEIEAPMRSPKAWAAEFADHALGMHIADKTLRMSKSEMMGFIRGASDDAGMAMFNALRYAQDAFEGWGKLLETAYSRYIVAISAVALEAEERSAG